MQPPTASFFVEQFVDVPVTDRVQQCRWSASHPRRSSALARQHCFKCQRLRCSVARSSIGEHAPAPAVFPSTALRRVQGPGEGHQDVLPDQGRLRQFFRHGSLTVALALAEFSHHTSRGQRVARAGEVEYEENYEPRLLTTPHHFFFGDARSFPSDRLSPVSGPVERSAAHSGADRRVVPGVPILAARLETSQPLGAAPTSSSSTATHCRASRCGLARSCSAAAVVSRAY